MPGKIKVKILAGRNLPVMDRSGDTTDAYVEIKFGNTTYKTDVCRKSLNPQWNSEWYRFEVDDAELQDEPLQIRLMDHDTYSANDAIGKVYLNLNPLLLPGVPPPVKNIWTLEATMNSTTNSQGGCVMTGWMPVYDTMHGIRGEVNVIVKVELFLDFNKFRQSSCGVQFFYSPNIPFGYFAQAIHGFVEELVVCDDPEYKWIDKIRTPRASNEARQILFFKLSGELQRKIGLKALDLGGNAVVGYLQTFDLEGECGIIARGIGTAVTLVKLHDLSLVIPEMLPTEEQQDDASLSPTCPTTALVTSTSVKASQSPVMKSSSLHRRSSDSDLSITPKGNSLTGSERSVGGYSKPTATVMRTTNRDALEMLEYPFLTMQLYPPGFIRHLGGLVSARSVKLIERINNLEEPEGRDSWWKEIRMEIRSHARALACNVVIGYKEETSLCSDDVCVLSASGTAAVISFHNPMPDADGGSKMPNQMATSIESDRDKQTKGKSDKSDSDSAIPSQTGKVKRISESNDHEVPYGSQLSACALCHLPYREKSVPFRMNVSKCAVCRKAKVPEVMFTTIELPENIPLTGNGCFIQATVCKSKKDLKGELNAKEISDCLPFLEYEVHSLLLNKLRVRGMNGIFGLRIQVTVGEKLVVGMAVGTAVFLTALPPPTLPQIGSNNSWHNEEQLAEIRKTLTETLRKNREYYHLKTVPDVDSVKSNASDTEDSDDELLPDMNIGVGSKDACVLEIDDLEDMDRISLLIDDRPPDDFHVVNTQSIPGLEDLEIVRNLQMFTQVSRSKIPVTQTSLTPSKHFTRLLQTVFFKLRRMVPCALCDMQFRVALPEQDEIQLCVVGMALGLGEPTKSFAKFRRKTVSHCIGREQVKKSDDTDMIFRLDEDQTENQVGDSIHSSTTLLTTNLSAQKPRSRSPLRLRSNTTIRRHRHVPLKERYGVDITPLSYLPGGRIERYLGNLNFFFIRESNSIRENGGLSGFTHSFVTEVLAIVRAHVTALGGNAMVAYFMTHCVLLHSPHKNQGQCLINVGGDVVCVSYFAEDKQGAGNTNC